MFCTPFRRSRRKALKHRSGTLTSSRSDTPRHRSWRMSSKRRKPIEFEEGSGNVFADLGLKHADQLLARAQIGFHVFMILKNKHLKQREIAEVLGIAQPDVSHLMNGH